MDYLTTEASHFKEIKLNHKCFIPVSRFWDKWGKTITREM